MATQKRNGRKRNATRQIRCPAGYRRDKNTRICRKIKSTRRRKRCPAGSRRVSGRCRSNPVRNCPPGYSRVRGRCLPQRCPTDTYNQCMYPDYSTVPYVLGQRCPDGSTRVCMQAQQLLDTIVDKNNAIEILNAEKIEAPNVQAGVALDDMIKELTVDALIAKKEIDVLAAAAPAVPNAQLDAIVQQADVAIQPAAAAAAAAIQVPKAPSVLQTVAAKIRQAAASLPNMKIDANRKATAAEVVNILAQNPTLTPQEVQIIAQNPEVTAAVVEALVDDNQVMTSNKVATMSKKPEVIQDALTLLRQPQTHRVVTPMNRLNNNKSTAEPHIFSSIMQQISNKVPNRFTVNNRPVIQVTQPLTNIPSVRLINNGVTNQFTKKNPTNVHFLKSINRVNNNKSRTIKAILRRQNFINNQRKSNNHQLVPYDDLPVVSNNHQLNPYDDLPVVSNNHRLNPYDDLPVVSNNHQLVPYDDLPVVSNNHQLVPYDDLPVVSNNHQLVHYDDLPVVSNNHQLVPYDDLPVVSNNHQLVPHKNNNSKWSPPLLLPHQVVTPSILGQFSRQINVKPVSPSILAPFLSGITHPPTLRERTVLQPPRPPYMKNPDYTQLSKQYLQKIDEEPYLAKTNSPPQTLATVAAAAASAVGTLFGYSQNEAANKTRKRSTRYQNNYIGQMSRTEKKSYR